MISVMGLAGGGLIACNEDRVVGYCGTAWIYHVGFFYALALRTCCVVLRPEVIQFGWELLNRLHSGFHDQGRLAKLVVWPGMDSQLPDKIGHGFGSRIGGGKLNFFVVDTTYED